MTSKLTLSLAEAKLFESGLTLADAKLLGLTFHDDLSVLHKQADQAEWRAGPGIKIPYFDLLGQPLETHPSWGPFWRTRRLEVPQEERSGFDKQTTGGPIAGVKKADHKYDQPPKTGTTAYFPPNLDWPSIAMDPEQSIILTEGEFKAMKSGKEGVPCIGLGGVWNYKSTETGVLFLQILEEIDWARRSVYIVYDSDVKDNEHVAKSINQLAEQLYLRGAVPYCVFLPEIEGLKKTGLDDYIVATGIEGLRDLCASSVDHLILSKAAWDWNERWFHITLEPHCVVNRLTGKTYKKEEYVSAHTAKDYVKRTVDKSGNLHMEPVSLIKEIFDWPLHSRLDRLTYDPARPKLERLEGESAFNCWPGWGLEPVEGDVGPYLELFDHIFGNDANEAKWLMAWFAYQIQHPGVKLKTAVLVTGAHGAGKSMMAEALQPIFGSNYSEVSGEDFFSQFNEWAARKQFVLANEVFANGDRDRKVHASALKNFVTRRRVTINEKYGLKYELVDYTNIYMTANPIDSLPIEAGERRYFVYRSLAPKIETTFLHRWDRWKESGGIEALFYYLLHKVDTSWFDPTAPALATKAVVEVVSYNESEKNYAIKEIMENGFKVGDTFIATDIMTVDEIFSVLGDSKIFRGPADVRKALTDNGAYKLQDPGTPDGRLRINNRYFTYWVLRNIERWKKAPIADVKKYLSDTPLGADHGKKF